MSFATDMIYRAAGSPAMSANIKGICALCGGALHRGILFADWVRDSFMDYDKLKPGAIICAACQFCCDDSSVTLQEKLRRDKPQRMRNYSHLIVDGKWLAFHKGQKAEMLALLISAPCEVAVLALSGQKHILFRARRGWWRVEEQAIFPRPAELADTAAAAAELLSGGFSKHEIESGQYLQHRIQKFGMARWRGIEISLAQRRQRAIFYLALWLAQKKEDGNGADA